MAGQTLVSKREAADQAGRDFLEASRWKRNAEKRLEREAARAQAAAKKSANNVDELEAAKEKHAQLKRAANSARRIADDLRQKAEEAWQQYEDAKSAAPAGQAQAAKGKEKPYGGDPEKLQQAAENAQAEADAAEQDACEAETDLAVGDDEMETLTRLNQELARVARAATREKKDAQNVFDAASKDVGVKQSEAKTARDEVLGLTITRKKLKDEWGRVSSLRQSRQIPTYLAIRVPSRDIDADATEALTRISRKSQVHRDELRTSITRHGIASEVAAITKELNRRRRSEVRTRVLAATYFESLLDMMNDYTGEEPRRKTTDEIVQEVKDTDGFVEAILLYQQEADDGPLKRFAKELVKIVIERKKLKIESGDDNLLADQLCARL